MAGAREREAAEQGGVKVSVIANETLASGMSGGNVVGGMSDGMEGVFRHLDSRTTEEDQMFAVHTTATTRRKTAAWAPPPC